MEFTTGGSSCGFAIIAKVVGHTWSGAAVFIAAKAAAVEVGGCDAAIVAAGAFVASIGTGPRITSRISLVAVRAGGSIVSPTCAANESEKSDEK